MNFGAWAFWLITGISAIGGISSFVYLVNDTGRDVENRIAFTVVALLLSLAAFCGISTCVVANNVF